MASKAIEFGEKNAKYGPLRRLRSFKVIDFGINRKQVCDFLLVLIELFSLCVTAEALVTLTEHLEGVAPHQSFLHG